MLSLGSQLNKCYVLQRAGRTWRLCWGSASTWNDETNPGIQVLRSKQPQVFGDVSHHPHFASHSVASSREKLPGVSGVRAIVRFKDTELEVEIAFREFGGTAG